MASDDALLAFDGVTAGYVSEIDILRDVSFRIRSGWITSIIGSNGAGKSTILRTVFGYANVRSGRILLADTDMTTDPVSRRIARGVSYVAQGRCNFPMMSVVENLKVACFTLERKRIEGEIERVLSIFPMLRQKAKDMAGNLSGGQQQILEMAMALVLQPRLLLIDEPTLGLSPKFFDEVFAQLVEIKRSGVTVLMVEQNAARALQISDWALVFDLGRLFKEGPAQAILTDTEVKERYLGGHAEV
ncbi:MAG: ABC transporter ATP-binding protein [Parvibaculaceae bacterium]